VQVDAYRDAARGNALPSYFGQLIGSTGADVKARGMAESRDANATDCLKPLAVPDRWTENNPAFGPWDPATSTFDKWDPANPSVLLSPPDSYAAATGLSSGTSVTITSDFGTQVVLKPGTTATPVSPIKPWNYLPVQIPDSTFGANDVQSNLTQCAGSMVAVKDRLNLVAGNVNAIIAAGMQDLIDRDPAASWSVANQRIQSSCADAHPRCASWSPRIIALAMYSPPDLADNSRFGATSVLVKSFVGFFIEAVAGNDITGRITRHPGRIRHDAPILIDDASFLRAALLVK
jgi:hypothetical protein